MHFAGRFINVCLSCGCGSISCYAIMLFLTMVSLKRYEQIF